VKSSKGKTIILSIKSVRWKKVISKNMKMTKGRDNIRNNKKCKELRLKRNSL
jgi:hypothetical protein